MQRYGVGKGQELWQTPCVSAVVNVGELSALRARIAYEALGKCQT